MNFNILTLGCKVNQYESQAMREELLRHGYTLSENREQADITMAHSAHLLETGETENGVDYQDIAISPVRKAVYLLLRCIIIPFRHLL